MTFDELAIKHENDVEIYDIDMTLKGLYSDGVVGISKNIETDAERTSILAEEIGHHFTTHGDILDQTKIHNIKQEQMARRWAYENIIPLISLVNAFNDGCRNKYETAIFLNTTEHFLEKTVEHYKTKYGAYKKIDNYIVYFDPLGVMKMI